MLPPIQVRMEHALNLSDPEYFGEPTIQQVRASFIVFPVRKTIEIGACMWGFEIGRATGRALCKNIAQGKGCNKNKLLAWASLFFEHPRKHVPPNTQVKPSSVRSVRCSAADTCDRVWTSGSQLKEEGLPEKPEPSRS